MSVTRSSRPGAGVGAPLLQLAGLAIRAPGRTLVEGVDVAVHAGEVTALCGPSGAGKSLTARACMGILDVLPGLSAGSLRYPGRSSKDWFAEVVGKGKAAQQQLLRDTEALRGGYLSYSPQAASSALNPGRTIGRQMELAVARRATPLPAPALGATLRGLLAEVGLAPHVAGALPGELSGGMCQRAALAIAMASDPRVLIADEPETGLDPVLRRQIVELLLEVGKAHACGILLISHHEDTVERIADHVIRLTPVVAGGGGAMSADQAPVTGGAAARPVGDAQVVRVSQVVKTFRIPGAWPWSPVRTVEAVRGVDFEVRRGEVVALVGQSGSGKTTLSRIILGLEAPSSGEVWIEAHRWDRLSERERQRHRLAYQYVPQDAMAALDPQQTVLEHVMETLTVLAGTSSADARAAATAMLARLGLSHRHGALPRELSGGEQRRVTLARVLALEPRLVVADEPTSGLDPDRRASVLADLIGNLPPDAGCILVTHDLDAAVHYCHRAVVMLEGRVIETLDLRTETPRHPYTRSLLDPWQSSPAASARKGAP